MARSTHLRLALLGAALVLMLVLSPSASAYIWWGHNYKGHGIGRAELDASDVRANFIPQPPGTYSFLRNAATDGQHVYWSTFPDPGNSSSAIGRANSDGSGINYSFTASGGPNVLGLGVNTTHLFWTSENSNTGQVGRTPIAGGQATQSIDSVSGQANPKPCGVATDGTYVYWANLGTFSIARAKLSTFGTLEDVEGQWIPLGNNVQPCGIAVNDSFVYWGVLHLSGASNQTGSTIGRANKDGTGMTNNLIQGVYGVTGLAILDSYLYWSSSEDSQQDKTKGTIGRSDLNGNGATTMIYNLEYPWGVAVDPGGTASAPPPPPPVSSTPVQLPPVNDPGGGPNRPTTPSNTPPPDFSRVWSTHKVFKPQPTSTPLSGYSIAARTAAAIPAGTTFNFIADRPGTVKISINLIGTGRKSGKVCKPATKKLATKPTCTQLIKLYTLTRIARTAGTNSVPFTGRIKGKALKPGRYRAIFTGVAGKRISKAKSADFRIVKG